jgi:primosomal protein N' (replication factor Y)
VSEIFSRKFTRALRGNWGERNFLIQNGIIVTMFIITIIPISRGIGKETLTYFTSEKVGLGSLVSVPIRGKKSYGLVVEIKEAREQKTELKNLSYAMKKIDKVQQRAFLSPTFVDAAKNISDYYATTVGSVLAQLVPKAILESQENFNLSKKENEVAEKVEDETENQKPIAREVLLLQTADPERYGAYKSVIREEFARGRSIFFCLPTIEDIKNVGETLQKGIENYTFVLHSRLSKKEIVSVWQKILAEKHPVLIIASGSFLSLPREDIGTIILEKESSRAYKMQVRPFLDIRTVAEIVAKKSGLRLIFGDQLLQTETIWKQKNGDYAELSPLSFRSLSACNCQKVDMQTPADMQKKEFKILGEETKKILLSARENSERTFVFCGRKGLFPQTVCADCGTAVTCKNCKAPVVLYKKKSGDVLKNLFVCHHCGERRDADVLCENCKGWRILPLGIGVQNVAEEVRKILPKSEIFCLDADTVTTYKGATKIRDDFFATPGSVLVGTEMALSFLNQNVENSIIASLDSFFSIPDFKISEKVFHILLQMRSLTGQKMLVQTRQPETALFDQALSGNLIDFYREQIAERKSLNYPPFAKFIKLTIQGNKIAIKNQMEKIAGALKPFELSVFEAFNPGPQNKSVVHGLLSIPPEIWPDKNLLEKLRALPQFVAIKIDPDTLL